MDAVGSHSQSSRHKLKNFMTQGGRFKATKKILPVVPETAHLKLVCTTFVFDSEIENNVVASPLPSVGSSDSESLYSVFDTRCKEPLEGRDDWDSSPDYVPSETLVSNLSDSPILDLRLREEESPSPTDGVKVRDPSGLSVPTKPG